VCVGGAVKQENMMAEPERCEMAARAGRRISAGSDGDTPRVNVRAWGIYLHWP
jgi:hypothetical protein